MNVDRSAENIERLRSLAVQMRLDGLDMGRATGNGGAHFGGGFSCTEILAVLFGEILNINSTNPEWNDRDIFLPSKEHCLLGWYPALYRQGYITREEMLDFSKDGSPLTGHLRDVGRGLEFSGGSLGMALSVAVGMALSAKHAGSTRKFFVLLGDGELQEGSNWEAMMSAAQFNLGSITAIVDRNRLSYDGATEDLMALDSLSAKFEAFNWQAISCDGHSVEDLLRAFSEIDGDKPSAIVAETTKGKGVSFMENQPEWHHKQITQEQYEQARHEILES